MSKIREAGTEAGKGPMLFRQRHGSFKAKWVPVVVEANGKRHLERIRKRRKHLVKDAAWTGP